MQAKFTIKPVAIAVFVVFGMASAAAQTVSGGEIKPRSAAADLDIPLAEVSAAERTRPFPANDQRAYFTNIRNGDRVKSPFRVAFAVSGMGVAPVSAGAIPGTGHHHILIDQPLPSDIKAPIPFDKEEQKTAQHYKHFGRGETETVLNLPIGKHTLQLLFADHRHVPYYIRSKVITIDVLP